MRCLPPLTLAAAAASYAPLRHNIFITLIRRHDAAMPLFNITAYFR